MSDPTVRLGLPLAWRLILPSALAALAALEGCGEKASAPSARAEEPAAVVAPAPVLKPVERVQSAELTRVRRALDHGRVEEARALIAQATVPELEGFLFQARASAIEGHDTDAMHAIEDARKLAPKDPSVFATAAEIYAGMGKTNTAWGEVVHGEEICGPSPEFLRARGVLAISQQGRAEKGLASLEQALAADPAIPFIDRALGQAHLLVAKERAKAEHFDQALEHARASVKFDPDEVDAQRLLSEMLTATKDYNGAILVLQALVQKGEPLESELALTLRNAGFVALLRGEREEALNDFIAARKYGLSAKELASAAVMLEEEAQKHLELGIDAYKKQDFDAAEQHFRRALQCDADLIQAQNHLAVVLYKKRDFGESVRLWRRVIATARAEKIELPEPVHLNLAKAQMQTGDAEGAALTLEEYLDRQPSGEWVAPTREMLASLPTQSQPR